MARRGSSARRGLTWTSNRSTIVSIARAELGIGHERAMLVDHSARVGEIPMEVAMDRRMIEVGERAIERRDRPPEVLEQGAATMSYGAERTRRAGA